MILIKQESLEQALKYSKSAVTLIEPIVFQLMKNEKEENLQSMKEFYDVLQVLLISYMNLGVIKFK